MHVIDYYNEALIKDEHRFSYEVVPSGIGIPMDEMLGIINRLYDIYPTTHIHVTSHSSQIKTNGDSKAVYKKTPDTLDICNKALTWYEAKEINLDFVPHGICQGVDKWETQNWLIRAYMMGLDNVFAIQGDSTNVDSHHTWDRNRYAIDLVKQIKGMNEGKHAYAEIEKNGEWIPVDGLPKSNFCIGVASYPETHAGILTQFRKENYQKILRQEVNFLKLKEEAGASYALTNMFFDNKFYWNLVDVAREEGIKMPIIPGYRIFNHAGLIEKLPPAFKVIIPEELKKEINFARKISKNPKIYGPAVAQVGVEWAANQIKDLLENSKKYPVPYIHMYVMRNPKPLEKLIKELKSKCS